MVREAARRRGNEPLRCRHTRPPQIRACGKQVEAQLADFAQTVKAGSHTELAMVYRLRDMLLSRASLPDCHD